MICCDGCDRWLHCGCDARQLGDEDQLERISQGNAKYYCPICRSEEAKTLKAKHGPSPSKRQAAVAAAAAATKQKIASATDDGSETVDSSLTLTMFGKEVINLPEYTHRIGQVALTASPDKA